MSSIHGAETSAQTSDVEREVLELLAQGLDNARIAEKLGIGQKTIRNHVSAVMAKLGLEGRSQAIVRAREAGFGRKPV